MKRALAIVSALLAFCAWAQEYPSRPVKLVNPYQAGGGIDMLARLFAASLQERWGQPVIVESKPGAGGNVGADYVAKSAPDGYTLLLTASTITTNPYFFDKIPFDAQKDLAPISLLAAQEFCIVASPGFAPRNMGELIAYAKKNPGKLAYATPGIGTPQHLGGELLKSLAGIELVHVPYKGQAPALNDVMAGQVQLTWVTLNGAIPLLRSDRVKGIAVAAPRRVASLPELPAVAETVPGYEVNTWFALFAPAGTPAPIIEQVMTQAHRIAALAEVREKLLPLGYDIVTSSPQELRALIAADLAKWGKLARDAGIRPQ
jgi:tripartite-type tricarboxylate transporter receptor subunit TctC